MVHGGVLGGGERSAHTIFEYSVPALASPGHVSYVALGHLHRMQRVPGPAPLWYSGSPLQLDLVRHKTARACSLWTSSPVSRQGRTGSPRFGSQAGQARRDHRPGGRAGSVSQGRVDPGRARRAEQGGARRRGAQSDPRDDRCPGQPVIGSRGSTVGQSRIGRTPRDLFSEYLEHRRIDDPRLSGCG